jgi:hypothetical protein
MSRRPEVGKGQRRRLGTMPGSWRVSAVQWRDDDEGMPGALRGYRYAEDP